MLGQNHVGDPLACPTHLPGLPTTPRHWGTWPNFSRPTDPSCPTHHGKLQALAPTTLLALLVAAPEFGLVTAEVTVATVHPPQAGCTGPTLTILPAVCVGLLGDKENAGAVTRTITAPGRCSSTSPIRGNWLHPSLSLTPTSLGVC